MNTPFQQDVWDYLYGGNEERKQALEDLVHRRFFSYTSEISARQALTTYLDKNPRGFCAEGIARARRALLKVKTYRGQATIEFDVEFDKATDAWRPRPDSSSGHAIKAALEGYAFENLNGPSAFRNIQVKAIAEVE